MMLYTDSIADQTDYFDKTFVRENDAYCCDNVMTFESLHRRHLFKESQCKKGDILMC